MISLFNNMLYFVLIIVVFVDECSHTNQHTYKSLKQQPVSVPLQVLSVFFTCFILLIKHTLFQNECECVWAPCLMFKETATREKCTLDRWRVRKKQSNKFYNQCRYYGNLARVIWRDTARLVCSFNVLKAATIIVLSLFSFSAPWGFLSLQVSFFSFGKRLNACRAGVF